MKKILIIVVLLLTGLTIAFIGLNSKKDSKDMELSSNFLIDLVKLTNEDYKDNYLISPYSIKVALNMLKEGAKGNTLIEINKVLAGSTFNEISNQNIKIANAAFVRKDFEKVVEKNFSEKLKNEYQAKIIYDKLQSPKLINDWVKKHTDGMIPKILDSVDGDFVLGIANAIALDAKWQYPFECDFTKKESFTNSKGQKLNVQMMHQLYQTSDVNYFDYDRAIGVIIPYQKDTNLEFIGILPKDGIDNYINNLTEKDFELIDKMKKSASRDLRISLSMPRFKYDFNLDHFKDDLIKMGIVDAFDGLNANFEGIITKENLKKYNRENLFIDDAIHKTAIDLNENGTKAAAVTYFGLRDSAIAIEDYEMVKINFDKPFVYMIRDNNTKEILFFGAVNTPNLWNGTTCN